MKAKINPLKKTLLTLIILGGLFFSNQLIAQSNWEAGVRFGNKISADLTIPLSAAPRLHTAVYFDRFGIGTYFDWMFA